MAASRPAATLCRSAGRSPSTSIPTSPDGLLYRSRHDPSRLCAAIFDRAEDALTATSLGSLADAHNVALLADLLDAYDYSLIVS